MGRRWQRGEAALEWVGMIVVVAVLGAAVTAWMASVVRPPERPPDVVAVVAAPLRAVPEQMGRVGFSLPALSAMASANESPARRALRWVVDRTGPAAVLVRDMGAAYGAGYLGRLRERVDRYVEDPVGQVGGVDVEDLSLPGVISALAEELDVDPDALRAYVRRIRAMSGRDAAVQVAGDAGTVAADVTVEAAEIVVRRWLLRGLLGRGGGSGGGGR